VDRLIGRYTGTKKGSLLVCFGSIHGNEPAGTQALERVFQMLEEEPAKNPAFQFVGRIIGLRGNLRAIQKGQRYLEKDLNRQWTPANVARILQTQEENLVAEDLEIRELLEVIHAEIDSYQPEKLIVLDLHTTTAAGGIFVIVTDDAESLRIGKELHAPVIQSLQPSVEGTTLHYFNPTNFSIPTVAVCFESGQHQEPIAVSRAIAAIINCLRTIGCVHPSHIENKHDQLLQTYSAGLPKVVKLIFIHRIQPSDNFAMKLGYHNFQPIKKGEVVAVDKNGPIQVEEDCLMLMPLYQKQGNDGFFLVKEV